MGQNCRVCNRFTVKIVVATDVLSCAPVSGLRLPVYKALACKAPVLPAVPIGATEPKPSDIDVSDLGTRNYGARTDFYRLVSEADV